MPKKKLTKAQVKRAFKQINKAMFRMFEDKFEHGTSSFVPISSFKLLKDFTDPLERAAKRIK